MKLTFQLIEEMRAALVWMCLHCILTHAVWCVGGGFRMSALSFPQWLSSAQSCTISTAAVLGAVSVSRHSRIVQASSAARTAATIAQWPSPLRQGLSEPLQLSLCQDDCIRPVRRFPVKDFPCEVNTTNNDKWLYSETESNDKWSNGDAELPPLMWVVVCFSHTITSYNSSRSKSQQHNV